MLWLGRGGQTRRRGCGIAKLSTWIPERPVCGCPGRKDEGPNREDSKRPFKRARQHEESEERHLAVPFRPFLHPHNRSGMPRSARPVCFRQHFWLNVPTILYPIPVCERNGHTRVE